MCQMFSQLESYQLHRSRQPLRKIEKEGKNKRVVKHHKSISFMIIDTKITSKVLGIRMRMLISCITNYDQTTWVKDRFMGE